MNQFSPYSPKSSESESKLDKSEQDIQAKTEYLEKRVEYLEETTRFTLDAIEMAVSLGDFQQSINSLQDPAIILDETRSRIQRLIQFKAIAFYLVDEDSNKFYPASTEPEQYAQLIEEELNQLIDEGTFAWVLRNRKPVTIPIKNHDGYLVLHVMATSSRVRGMFVGLTDKSGPDILDIALSLLSVILLNSSNALESYELYKMIREISKSLENRENYRVLFEAAPDGVEVLDASGRIVDCNQAFEALIENGREHIIGKHTSDFYSDINKELHASMFPLLKRNGYHEGELELVSSNGSILKVWRKEKAIHDEQMNFVGSVVYNRDISALKRSEEDRRNLEAQLQRTSRLEAIGTLAGGIAHDLNNILTPIMGYAELTLRGVASGSKVERNLQQMIKGAERARDLIKQILLFSRQTPQEPKPVKIAHIIPDTLKLLCATLPRAIEIHQSVQSDKLVLADPTQIQRIFLNLCTNAAHAMREKGGRLEVLIEDVDMDAAALSSFPGLTPGTYLRLTVSDTGHGMDKTILDRIFDPFFTTKTVGEGSGMGLAVVHGIVKSHGGAIEVRSTPGHGTIFHIYFPTLGSDVSSQDDPESGVSKGGELILFVDDEEIIASNAQEILELIGYRVITATSCPMALEVFHNNKDEIDLVVTDYIMPHMTGIDLAHEIRLMRPGIPILLCSGFTDRVSQKQAREMGINGLIMKPFSLGDISKAIRKVLPKRSE